MNKIFIHSPRKIIVKYLDIILMKILYYLNNVVRINISDKISPNYKEIIATYIHV